MGSLLRAVCVVGLFVPATACVDGKTPDCAGDAAICGYDQSDAPVIVDAPSDAPADVLVDAPVQDAGKDTASPVDAADASDAKAG